MVYEKVFEKYYKTWVGSCHYALYEVETLTLPWSGGDVGEEIAKKCKNKLEDKGFIVLKTVVSKEDILWSVYQKYKVEIWCIEEEKLSLGGEVKSRELVASIIIGAIAAVIMLIIGYYIVQEIRKIVRPETIKQFVCPECGAVFNTASSYDSHMCQEHGICKHTCPYCGASFDTQEELEKHIEEVHGGANWVKYLPWIIISIAGIGGLLVISKFIKR